MSILVCACLCLGSGCVLLFHRSLIWQAIPITVQQGKPVIVKIQVRNDSNEVYIRCAPALWNDLTNSVGKTTVQLKASTKPGTKISYIYPFKRDVDGRPWSMAALIPDTQYLCVITGKHRAIATLEIDFPSGPPNPTPAEIIVTWEPYDMGF